MQLLLNETKGPQSETTAKIYIEDSGGNQISLRAYQNILMDIVQSKEITSETLLNSEPYDLTYNNYKVITSITRMKS